MAVRLTQDDFEFEIRKTGRLAIIDFYSDSCVSCKRMSPVLAELEETYSESLFVGKVNIAYEPELTEKHEVTSVPTFLLFKDGRQIKKITGIARKTEFENIMKENVL